MARASINSPFGDEYPAAMYSDGMRMRLVVERRWTRTYATEDRKNWAEISRFMDGSATITFDEFSVEWPGWNANEREDFCRACYWLSKRAEFPDMLRLIMRDASPAIWSMIANLVGRYLPHDEAFSALSKVLRSTPLGKGSNISQGISQTHHAEARGLLEIRLADLWAHADLRDDDKFTNWIAFEATCCIEHLLKLGAPGEDFIEQVRELSRHSCAGNRRTCRNYLAEYYPWLAGPGE